MIAALRDRFDAFLGRGAHSTSVPVMDGPLQPNHLLDKAEILQTAPSADNLVLWENGLAFSSGSRLLWTDNDGTQKLLAKYEAEITCLAVDGSGGMAVGRDGAGVELRGGRHDGNKIETVGGKVLGCVTSMLFLDADTLVVASGSENCAFHDWKRDLMTIGRTGTVWRIDLTGGEPVCLAHDLGFPYGLARAEDGGVVASEAWCHRLVRLPDDGVGAPVPILSDLPGYPSRLAPGHDAGYWLAVFAPRNQLVEFVLREKRFRQDMTEQVDPAFWIAPALRSGDSFREPLQGGAVKQMGIIKPWAPVWAYGLVVRLDADFQPVASWHSRADGIRHGVTSVCEDAGRLAVSAKGAGLLLLMNEVTITGEAV